MSCVICDRCCVQEGFQTCFLCFLPPPSTDGGTIELDQKEGGNSIYIKNLPQGCNYAFTQVLGAGFTCTAHSGEAGTMTSTTPATASFVNAYATSAKIEINGSVKVGRTEESATSAPAADSFSFAVIDNSGNLVSVKNDSDGNFRYAFGDIATESNFALTVKQASAGDKTVGKYDDSVYTVNIAAADNGDGTMKVTFDYTKAGTNASQADFVNIYNSLYTVKHVCTDTSGANPQTYCEETAYALAGTNVTPKVLSIPNYIAPTSEITKEVTADDTMVVEYTYTKNPAGVEYSVKHYKEKTDKSGYEEPVLEKQYASAAGETATPIVKGTAKGEEFEGFTAPTPTPVTVMGDGSTVAELYYTINSYVLSFDANGHGLAPAKHTVVYSTVADKPDDPTASGYTFGGWFKDKACTDGNSGILR